MAVYLVHYSKDRLHIALQNYLLTTQHSVTDHSSLQDTASLRNDASGLPGFSTTKVADNTTEDTGCQEKVL